MRTRDDTVQSMQHAKAALAAGADSLVAQGNEAGGHTGSMNLLPFLARMLDRLPDLPVTAAGAIANGRTRGCACYRRRRSVGWHRLAGYAGGGRNWVVVRVNFDGVWLT